MKRKLISVYGSLRQGLHNEKVLNKSEYLGSFNSEPIFTMIDLYGNYPGIVKGGNTSVLMEVYVISDETEQSLNVLEGYSGVNDDYNYYNREIIETPYGNSFVYLYNDTLDDYDLVESGDWKEYKEDLDRKVIKLN